MSVKMTKGQTIVPRKKQFFIRTIQGRNILLYLNPDMKVSTLQEILNHFGEFGGPPGWTLIKYKGRMIYSEQNILEIIKYHNEEDSLEISLQLTGLLVPVKPRIDHWLENFGVEAQNKVHLGGYFEPSSKNYLYSVFDFSKKSNNRQYTKKSRKRAFRLMILNMNLVILPEEVWLKQILPLCISPAVNEDGQITKCSTRYV